MVRTIAINIYLFFFMIDIVTSYEQQGSDDFDSGRQLDGNALFTEYENWDEGWDYDYYYYSDLPEEKDMQMRDIMLPTYNYMLLPRPSLRNACFPGSATVTLDNGSIVTMAQLEEGQKILTATNDGELVYSQVLTFLKRNHDASSSYLMLETSSTAISLSKSHVIFVTNTNNTIQLSTKFAGDVEVGDQVLVSDDDDLKPEVVIHIHELVMEGLYVPLTEHGTLIVDGILASCYASFNHWLANFFLTPLRWWPSVFGLARVADGMPAYVYAVKEVGHFLLPSSYQVRNQWSAGLLPVS